MPSGYRVVDAPHAVLNERPESLNRVRVDIPAHVDLFGVVDAVVLVSRVGQSVVDLVFVGEDGRSGHDARRDVRHDGGACDVRHGHGHRRGHGAEPCRTRASSSCRIHLGGQSRRDFAADVRLVNLDLAGQLQGVVLLHEVCANQAHHAGSRLVGNAKLPLHLLRGDTASCAGHEEHGVEPELKRRRGLVVDRASGRVEVEAAAVARPRLALLRRLVALEHALRLALRAMGVLAVRRVAVAPQPFKAGGIIGETRG